MKIEFNTGRQYTAEGQRITAEIIDTRMCNIIDEITHLVRMVDHSRGIEYLYELPELTQRLLMTEYDHNRDVSYDRLVGFWERT